MEAMLSRSPYRWSCLLLLVGCALDASGKNACRVDKDCPPGNNACIEGFCVAPPAGDGGPAADASMAGGSPDGAAAGSPDGAPDGPVGDAPDGAAASPPVLAVSAGTTHTCVLRPDHTIGCWGLRDRVMAPSGLYLQLSAGVEHTCGLTAAGKAVCWGWDT